MTYCFRQRHHIYDREHHLPSCDSIPCRHWTDWLDGGPKDLGFYFLDYVNSITLFENLDFVGVIKLKTLA